MRRREFLACLFGAIATHQAFGQLRDRLYRVGFLSSSRPPAAGDAYLEALNERLMALGYATRVKLETRYAEGDLGRLPALAGELTALEVDALIAAGNPAIAAVRRATESIPIVMLAADPVAAGFVPSLARPGGNLTGLAVDAGLAIWGKRLQLLKECAPAVKRVGVISRTGGRRGAWVKVLDAAAGKLAVGIVHAGARNADDFPAAFAKLDSARIDGLLVSDTPIAFQYRHLLIEYATRAKLPAVHAYREATEDGGLMSYGVDVKALYRSAASYLDRLFRGAKPADLPIEQPTKFELVVNLKTAQAIDIPIPQALALRADRVIE